METRSFTQIINKVIANGAEKVEIERSKGYCGCAKPGDIISVIVYKAGCKKPGAKTYWCVKAALQHVFDNPTIKVEALLRDIDTDRCLDTMDGPEFEYQA